ncbi:MAG TPA: FlgD immunoglobulin-like domain containing protein, partial [Candidatus Syntrophosphaera thermopropionivorans]|nr:FlgD immunoglobulin-like domain containing protein [Candidatus Syntrophosphaera thermopropionivorans]
LDIYNVRGQKIKTLLNDNLSAGIHNCIWDGKDDNGQIVSSAMYIVRLDDGNKIKQHKMMLIK